MLALPDLFVFITALIAVYLLPGPDMALVLSTSIVSGVRNGLMTAVGLAISRTLHLVLSALGLAALLHTHQFLFDAARYLGAAYLLFLAWKMLQTKAAHATPLGTQAGQGWSALLNGVMTNLLNPKALLFCALLLPQFITSQYNLGTQYLTLGVILVGLGLAFDVAYALAAAHFAQRFSGENTGHKVLRLMFACTFGFISIRLVMSGG